MNHLPRFFHLPVPGKHEDKSIHFSPILQETAPLEEAELLARMKSAAEGLSGEEAARRLVETGPNVVAEGSRRGWAWPLNGNWESVAENDPRQCGLLGVPN